MILHKLQFVLAKIVFKNIFKDFSLYNPMLSIQTPNVVLPYPRDYDMNKLESTLPKVSSTQDTAFRTKYYTKYV